MTTLVVLFIIVLLGSSIGARMIVKDKDYDRDLFTLGGLLGGPWAIHAALTAASYSVEVDEEELAAALPPVQTPAINEAEHAPVQTKAPGAPEEQAYAPIIQPELPTQDEPAAPSFAEPALPEDGIPQPEQTRVNSPELQGLQAPPLPKDAPQIQHQDPNAPLPAIPDALQSEVPEIKAIAPLAGHAPVIPHDILAPSIPQDFAPPVLPKEIPAPKPIVEPQDDEHKDPSVPAVANDKLEEQVAPQPRSLIDLVGAEAPTQLRRGVEFYEAGGIDEDDEPTYAEMLGKPDENGIPTEAVAPGESTCGMCPHCGHDTWADWYGLCVECMQPFPVKVAWFDPTAPVTLDDLSEGDVDDGKGKKKINLPGLKR